MTKTTVKIQRIFMRIRAGIAHYGETKSSRSPLTLRCALDRHTHELIKLFKFDSTGFEAAVVIDQLLHSVPVKDSEALQVSIVFLVNNDLLNRAGFQRD